MIRKQFDKLFQVPFTDFQERHAEKNAIFEELSVSGDDVIICKIYEKMDFFVPEKSTSGAQKKFFLEIFLFLPEKLNDSNNKSPSSNRLHFPDNTRPS